MPESIRGTTELIVSTSDIERTVEDGSSGLPVLLLPDHTNLPGGCDCSCRACDDGRHCCNENRGCRYDELITR